MIDYLIVGAGLAGISFAELAINNGKQVVVFDNDSQNSSRIAGGLYNPVILKRFSEVWDAENQLKDMADFYDSLKDKFSVTLDHKLPIYRKFFSVEEQNNWFLAADKKALSPFLSTNLQFLNFKGIHAPYGYGEVLHTGYVDTALLLQHYHDFLKKFGWYRKEEFNYSALSLKDDRVAYNGVEAKHVIFAEGFGLHNNPYFNFLPLDGTKGELFIIKANDLNIDVIVNTSVFILPLGEGLFKVGATYNWKDKTDLPTKEGRIELIERIKEIINCDFEVVQHFAGVRPTVRDRKPLVGTHNLYPQLHILNGLGTRGVMLGPSMAKALYNQIENKMPLVPEINWVRFLNKNWK
ncbi:NAD(P)/FAD-dependent oxidoreductase [Flavobacterium sp. RSSA_27]|uniref:NAD(P)/FAD-dependent oxidoreductase n=1 Tax=Flavobacterium sp. RSSA_27 TaxID=3447667 RepID=UPI003F31872E